MHKISVLVCFALISIARCADQPLQEFSEGNEKFSADIVKATFGDGNDKHIISPLSVELVLALLADGANGDTYTQLQRALSLPNKERTTTAVRDLLPILNKSNQNFNLSIADKLYINNKFTVKKEFQNVAVSTYQSELENVNFAENTKTADLINKWVAGKTNDKIQNIISADQLNAATALVLVNTLYLNAKWKTPFQKTTKGKFYHLKKDAADVDMMHSSPSARYLYFHCGFLKAKFLEIQYQDSTVSATFVLPDARDGLQDLGKNVELYLKPHNLTVRNVAVSLPTFSATTTQDFKKVLIDLGASKVFTPTADLTGISDTRDLFVDFVQQKAFINITEIGTEAAAATAVGVGTTSVQLPPELSFVADHPFFYFIRESKSNAILFLGRFQ